MTTTTITGTLGTVHLRPLPSGYLCVAAEKGDQTECAHVTTAELRAALNEAAPVDEAGCATCAEGHENGRAARLVVGIAPLSSTTDLLDAIKSLKARADKAEENVRAREEMINRLAAALEQARADAAQPRPLTADDITDEMVDRGFRVLTTTDKIGAFFVRELLTAAPWMPRDGWIAG